MKIAVIVNPVSGGGRGRKVWQILSPALRALFDEVECRLSNKVDDLIQMTRSLLAGKPDYFLVIGGDGTLSHVLNGWVDKDRFLAPSMPLAYYNAGCGGDFARQFPEQHITDFLERLKNRTAHPVNIGKITFSDDSVHYFINIASCGMSALVAAKTQQSKWLKKLGGGINYFVHSLSGLFRYESLPVSIQIDENPAFNCKMLMMAICNGQYFGGRMHVAPLAKVDDDLLDVVIFHDFTRLSAMFKLRKIYSGNHLLESKVHYVQAKKICIESRIDSPIFVEADGEGVGKIPVCFELLADKVAIIL